MNSWFKHHYNSSSELYVTSVFRGFVTTFPITLSVKRSMFECRNTYQFLPILLMKTIIRRVPSRNASAGKPRDVVLEASASARGGLEALRQFFLAGSASLRPHTVLPRSWLGLEGSALPRLGSNQST